MMNTPIGLEDIVRIFTFLLGTSLQIATLILMAKRKGQKRREMFFAFFTFSVLGWTFGIFISLFCGYLYWTYNTIEKIFASAAVFSFALVLPLLNHILADFAQKKYFKISAVIRYCLYLALYLPFGWFAHCLWPILKVSPETNFLLLENFISQFIPWVFVHLLLALYITLASWYKATDEDEKSWMRILYYTLVFLVLLYFVCFIMDVKKISIAGPYLAMLTQMTTFCLPPMLAYYMYSYSYIEYVFKRGLIYSVLAVVIISFYVSVIRPVGDAMEKNYFINFRMIEGIWVMALVFFFDTMKRGLQECFNRIFFRERQYYHKVFSDISTTINHSSYLDLENLLDDVARTISRAMKIREVSFIFFTKEKEKLMITASTLAIDPEDIKSTVEYIANQHLLVLDIYDLNEGDLEIIKEMKKIKAFTIISAYNEKRLIGILSIGKRLIRHRLLAEEEEMLILLLNQMVIAIENTRLVRQKFLLERKIYENEKLSSLGRLSASIAHEVKNPLSSIKTITQVTKEDLPPDDPKQEGLDLILGEIERLSRVVKQLLRFARPHASHLEEVSVQEVLNDVLILLQKEAQRNHVILIHEGEANISFLSDKDALIEIFFNLINNAIQALPSGGIVKISRLLEYQEGKNIPAMIRILVSDNGPGIPLSDREKIFEPFYTTKQSGTGLGLTIVKQRLKKLKGDILVYENHPGAVFEVRLPVEPVHSVEIPLFYTGNN
ncbi:MAG: hypothetical protein HUU50_19375 [Candidatus Brocadiae bacterium]|nr:hypothetical protein [Candidatus Brocadiia bacterium]